MLTTLLAAPDQDPAPVAAMLADGDDHAIDLMDPPWFQLRRQWEVNVDAWGLQHLLLVQAVQDER